MSAMFWFIAGVATGVAGAFVAVPLWRAARGNGERPRLRYAVIGCGVAIFAVATATIYHFNVLPAPLSAKVSAPPAGKAQSLETATAGLEARLSRQGGSASEWTLLAQSYEFLGRTADARRASERAAAPGAPTAGTPAPGQTNIALLWEAATASSSPDSSSNSKVAANPDPRDAAGWLARADLHRQKHENEAARAAFIQVIELNGMTAQSWADYADVLGSLAGGSLLGEAGRALDRALALDPANPKALWLQASRFHEQHLYTAALSTWKTLRKLLPADSPDRPLVDANIEEAIRLSGGPAAQNASEPPS